MDLLSNKLSSSMVMFFVIRDLLPREAIQPLIDELQQKISDLANEAIQRGLSDAANIFDKLPFETRLAEVAAACSDRNWIGK